jgi:hypothetical protein
MNLIEAGEKVRLLLTELMQSEAVQNLAATPKMALEKVSEKLDSLMTDLETINQNYLDLRRTTEETKHLQENLVYWENLAPGRIRSRTPEFLELKQNSATITELFRAAIDIEQVIKFSDSEIEFAKGMGDRFRKFQQIWQVFKAEIARGGNGVETIVAEVTEVAAFFGLLKRFGIITGYSTAIHAYQDNTWVDRPIGVIKQVPHKNTRVGFGFTFVTEARGLITGDWFNAYAYELLQDQLKRLEVDFEIYPMVSYKSAANVSLSKGEIDVLARINDHILVVECKSGRIRDDASIAGFDTIIGKFEALKRIFEKSRLPKFTFILVYNPFLVNPNELARKFTGGEIIPIGIDDLRGKIIDFIQALAAAD